MVSLKAEMMVLFDTIQAVEMGGKKPSPISGRHDGTTAGRCYIPQMLHTADSSTTRAKSSSELTSAFLNFLLTRPKQASGENFVWPVIMKCNEMV